MVFRSRRERWLWLAAAAYTLALYASLSWVRVLTEALRQRGLLRATVYSALALAAVLALGWALRRRPDRRELLVLAAVAAGYVPILVLAQRPEEQFHLLQYGVLAGLLYAALVARQAAAAAEGVAPARPGWNALLLTVLVGWVDEGIQELLPNRYYDFRDVVLNAAAGGLAIAALAGRAWARRRRAVASASDGPPAPASR